MKFIIYNFWKTATVKDYSTPAIDPSRKLLLDGRCRIILNRSSYAWLKCGRHTYVLFGQFHLKLDGGQLRG